LYCVELPEMKVESRQGKEASEGGGVLYLRWGDKLPKIKMENC